MYWRPDRSLRSVGVVGDVMKRWLKFKSVRSAVCSILTIDALPVVRENAIPCEISNTYTERFFSMLMELTIVTHDFKLAYEISQEINDEKFKPVNARYGSGK